MDLQAQAFTARLRLNLRGDVLQCFLSLSLLYHAGITTYPPTRMSTIPNPQNARNKDIAVGPVKLEKAQHELGVMVPHMRPPCGDGRKGETTG